MKCLRLIALGLSAAAAGVVLAASTTRALGPVLISGVQLKGVGDGVSVQEAVELHNYSEADVEVTGWCLVYASYQADKPADAGGSCIVPQQADDRIFLRQQSAIVMTTNELTASLQLTQADFRPDGVLKSGLGNDAGQLYLVDSQRQVIDSVKWNRSTESPAGEIGLRTVSGQPANISFFRQAGPITGLPGEFEVSPLPLNFQSGGLYELIDACQNISGFQGAVPDGYSQVESACQPLDSCRNLDGLQPEVPDGYYQQDDQCLPYENRLLVINELLPNPAGVDKGLEYIELYNPFDEPISLDGYQLRVGKLLDKSYKMPLDQVILPGGYLVITNAMLPFTLLNTGSSLQLVTPAGTLGQPVSYAQPTDDMSWSLIGGVWSYSNQKTPGDANLPTLMPQLVAGTAKTAEVVELVPCAAGKYRSPETNRCRNVPSETSTSLGSCQPDEYRNPATNRCRKFSGSSTSLAACASGQERNPATNRCRSVLASSTTLTPCQPGQERNPATNRCRKLTASTSVAAAVAGDKQSMSAGKPAQSPYALGAGIALLAAGYGVYEWRSEIVRGWRRLISFSK